MAAPHTSAAAVTQDTPIVIKISVNDQLKKLKLPLRDLGATVLPDKLRQLLAIKPEQTVILERYSDSAGGYITLDESNPQVFKTLIRAAKAKLKLRLKATVSPVDTPLKTLEQEMFAPGVPKSKMPAAGQSPRESTALDQRSIGSGIFQFREARASQQTLVNDEAPILRSGDADTASFLRGLGALPQPTLAFRPRKVTEPVGYPTHSWSVFCNECDKAMNNEHFHCSICHNGDYDLCQECVGKGKVCPGEDHWLIKRFIQDGKVVNSTTERSSPRKVKSIATSLKPEPSVKKEMPGTFTDETKTLAEEPRTPTRTCNNCVIVLSEHEFVTCTECDDFDLCIKCHTANNHGHHPAHGFKPATDETILELDARSKLAPGRNVPHNALCDGCDKKIYGVRHKCLNCPDWDLCNDCIKDARQTHPRHRFAALYQPIAGQGPSMVQHFGIFCDGPLCSKNAAQPHIHGPRYKCTICDNTDFCASCEALPGNHHNHTHPLIMLKTPVRRVNVLTENEDRSGNVRVLGDRRQSPLPVETKSAGTETMPIRQANAATQVQTVADFQPTEVKKEETKPIPIPVKKSTEKISPVSAAASSTTPGSLLNATYIRDTITDGMVMVPESRFTQVWTLRNPGPCVWPAGCSVRYVGGDNMLNVDNKHSASITAIAEATESNVVGREVQVGEEVAFKIVLKAPVREGKSISYWRLKSADGTPFGHRLWCDIEVKKTVPAQVPAQPLVVPHPMKAVPAYPTEQQEAHAPNPYQREIEMLHAQAQAYAQKQLLHLQAQAHAQKQLPAQPLVVPHPMKAVPAYPTEQQEAHRPNPYQREIEMLQAQAQAYAQKQLLRPSFIPPANPSTSANPYEMGATSGPVAMTYPAMAPAGPSGQPPSYDSMNLSARMATMREQQKQRRDQMVAQLTTQREQLQAQGIKREDKPGRGQHLRPVPYTASKALESMNEKERREVLKQRVAHIKANILKTREEREKLADELSKQKAVDAQPKTIDEMKMIIANIAKYDEEQGDTLATEKKKLHESQMVFPKLDRESPASSTYHSTTSTSKGKAAYVENEAGEIERSATPVDRPLLEPASPASGDEFVELDDELEVLSAAGDESSDDGFLTDEEYDILDASDQETVVSKC